jgi:hypothetical protein
MTIKFQKKVKQKKTKKKGGKKGDLSAISRTLKVGLKSHDSSRNCQIHIIG